MTAAAIALRIRRTHSGDDKIHGRSSDLSTVQFNAADSNFFQISQRAPGGEFCFDRVSDENVHRNIVWLRWHGVGHAFDAPVS